MASKPSRFDILKAKLAQKGASAPAGLAAVIGRRKYGKKRFQQMGAVGKIKAAIKHRRGC